MQQYASRTSIYNNNNNNCYQKLSAETIVVSEEQKKNTKNFAVLHKCYIVCKHLYMYICMYVCVWVYKRAKDYLHCSHKMQL